MITNENYRRECEAREWIRRGFRTKDKVYELMIKIKAKRGELAANELKAEMRKQWRILCNR
jgi:hypothetical protein